MFNLKFGQIILSFVIFLLIVTTVALADENNTIKADGISIIINNDLEQSRKIAIDNALRIAIEQSVANLISGRTDTKNLQLIQDSIKSKAVNYVSNYEILNESYDGCIYNISIKALIKKDILKQDINSLKLEIAIGGKPRVIVAINELRTNGLKLTEPQVRQALITSGFSVFDQSQLKKIKDKELITLAQKGDENAGLRLVNDYQVEILITGNVSSSLLSNIDGLITCRAYLELKAIRLDTGRMLVTNTLNDVGTDLSEAEATKKALMNVGEKTGEYLKTELGKQLIDINHSLQITVNGISYPDLQLLYQHLKECNGIDYLFLREFQGDNALLDIDTELSPDKLVNQIKNWDDLNELKVISILGNRIILKKEKK